MRKQTRRPTVRRLRDLLLRARQKRDHAGDGTPSRPDGAGGTAGGGRAQEPAAGGTGGRQKTVAAGGLKEFNRVPLSVSLDENLEILKSILQDFPGFNVREFLLAGRERAAVVFVEGMIDQRLLGDNILHPLMSSNFGMRLPAGAGSLTEFVRMTSLTASPVRERRTIGETARDILQGQAILLLDGEPVGLSVEVTGFPTRSIQEPVSEATVRGPREGFTESLACNLNLITRRLKTPNLAVENFFLGRETHTQVSVLYIRGRVNPEHLAELRRRLQRIGDSVDGVLESSYLEELIADHPLSPFPQALNTERPDRVAAALLEGRIAILVDNTPFALVVPYEFMALMQASEDYYQNYWFSTAIRILRYIALIISLVGPATYVAITTFHQEMIPERLLVQVVVARQGIPFPAVIEMLLIDYAFEILREAGIRLPRSVGQAVSIVGALVIGQAAIQAGLTSPLAVIIVALTGIASFTIPSFSLAFALRVLRFPLTILGGILGLYGVIVGVLAIIIHLCSLRTLGVPYLAGFTPLHLSDLKDSVIRYPLWAMRRRPQELSKRNPHREEPGLKPGPET